MTEKILFELREIIADVEQKKGSNAEAYLCACDSTGSYEVSKETSEYIFGVLKAIVRGVENGD